MTLLSRRLLGFCVILACSTYAVLCSLHYVSLLNSERLTEESLQKAIRLEPSNAENYYRLGVLEAMALMEPEKSVEHFEKAISLSPYCGECWLKMAVAYRIMGEETREHDAIVKALEVAPSWEVLNDAAIQLFTSGHVAEALPLYRTIMKVMPYKSYEYIPLLLRTLDVPTVLKEADPKSPQVYSFFITYLIDKERYSDAKIVLTRALDEHQVPERSAVLRLIDELLRNNDGEHSLALWQRLGKVDPEWRQYAPENGLVNGGFEMPLLRGGLDWRVSDSAGIEANISRESPAVGDSALRISIDRPSLLPANFLWTYLPVQQSLNYEIRFRFRTSGLSSASIPRVIVADCSGNSIYASEALENATAWREVHGSFTVPKGCNLTKILLNREDPGKLIVGKLWLDDFGVTPR